MKWKCCAVQFGCFSLQWFSAACSLCASENHPEAWRWPSPTITQLLQPLSYILKCHICTWWCSQLCWSARMPCYCHPTQHQHPVLREADADICLVRLSFQPASAHCSQCGLIPHVIQIILLLNLIGNEQKQQEHYSAGILTHSARICFRISGKAGKLPGVFWLATLRGLMKLPRILIFQERGKKRQFWKA